MLTKGLFFYQKGSKNNNIVKYYYGKAEYSAIFIAVFIRYEAKDNWASQIEVALRNWSGFKKRARAVKIPISTVRAIIKNFQSTYNVTKLPGRGRVSISS